MITEFTRFGLAGLIAATLCGTATAVEIGNTEFSGFVKRIAPREDKVKDADFGTIPQDPTLAIKKEAVKRNVPKRFIGWNSENPSLPNFEAPSEDAGEKMDSVVGTYLTGAAMSKQTFEFTENGRPVECRNYIPADDGKSYQYVGHYKYEYDSMGRVIVAESVNTLDAGNCQRMEYTYDGDSHRYNLQIAYVMDAEGEWMPYQKGVYAFDSNGNTTEESYYMWVEEDVNDWVPVQRTTATYDELNRLTSYFPYLWDSEANAWIGNSQGASAGQSFVYTQNGADAEKAEYAWVDGEWVKYYRTVYTYNDAALMIKQEDLYWNRSKQDWSGNETWGPQGAMKYNQYELYEYDEYGRRTVDNVYKNTTGTFVNFYRMTDSYTELENGEIERESTSGSVTADGTYTPNAKNIQRFNKFGSQTYYCSYRMSNDEWMPQQEQVRYMDEYNWFLGGDYYNYVNGQRKPSSKERFTYADDFDPLAGYETPIEGRHWVGTSSSENDGWKLKHVDSFTWGPRGVMIGYVNYDYLMSQGMKTSGWDTEYDFDANASNIFMWPDANHTQVFYDNKTIESTNYFNANYRQGVDEWTPEVSYKFTYFYSKRTPAGVDGIEVNDEVVEVARYDLTGRRLAAPAEGINIVRYSDGSSKKVMVKF